SQVHHAAHRIQFHALGPIDAMFGGKVVEAHDAEHSVSKLFRHYAIPNFVGYREPNRVEPPAPLTQLTRHDPPPPFSPKRRARAPPCASSVLIWTISVPTSRSRYRCHPITASA